ncbi:MAG: hypothetical protein LUD72_09995, partial [Bacteroidales bacterium]|nr:hypothetical protein [Bacteroidales bacterium]
MKKKLFILFLTFATAICIAIGITACGESSSDNENINSSGKQVPVYQGMVISSAADGVSALSSDGDIATFASAEFKG